MILLLFLRDELREHLKNAPKMIMTQKQDVESSDSSSSSETDSSSDSDSDSSSSSSESSSSSDSSSSSSDSSDSGIQALAITIYLPLVYCHASVYCYCYKLALDSVAVVYKYIFFKLHVFKILLFAHINFFQKTEDLSPVFRDLNTWGTLFYRRVSYTVDTCCTELSFQSSGELRG